MPLWGFSSPGDSQRLASRIGADRNRAIKELSMAEMNIEVPGTLSAQRANQELGEVSFEVLLRAYHALNLDHLMGSAHA